MICEILGDTFTQGSVISLHSDSLALCRPGARALEPQSIALQRTKTCFELHLCWVAAGYVSWTSSACGLIRVCNSVSGLAIFTGNGSRLRLFQSFLLLPLAGWLGQLHRCGVCGLACYWTRQLLLPRICTYNQIMHTVFISCTQTYTTGHPWDKWSGHRTMIMKVYSTDNYVIIFFWIAYFIEGTSFSFM